MMAMIMLPLSMRMLLQRGSGLALQVISQERKKNAPKQGIYTPQPDNAIYQIISFIGLHPPSP